MRVAVLGAGPMGLVTACRLARAGASPVVFEADSVAGGMSASFDFDGVQLERYYHFINMPDTALFGLLREQGMEDALRWQPTRMGFFRPDPQGHGRLYEWGNPLALLRFPGVSLLTRIRYGLHAFSCKFLKNLDALDDESAADWIRRWEGREGYNALWKPLFEKKFFELADPLSAAWIASRVRRVANSRASLMQERMGYLEHGTQSLVDSLIRTIETHGGEVRLSMPITRVRSTPTPEVHWDGGKQTFDAVVSTVPLPLVPELIENLPAGWRKQAGSIHNIGCACALFRLREPLTDMFWLNADMPDWDVPGIIEYSNLRPMSAAYVYVPFYMPHTHPLWKADDATVLNRARHCLRDVNPAAVAGEEAAQLFRYTWAQPVCPPGFRHQLPSYATGLPGIFAADTSHSFPEDRSINESTRIGEELAQCVLQQA